MMSPIKTFGRSISWCSNRGGRGRVLLLLLACLVCGGGAAAGANEVAIIVSLEIRPYFEAAKGLTAGLSEVNATNLKTFYLNRFRGKGLDDLAARLRQENFDLYVAVGPRAARFVWQDLRPEKAGRLYTMVLNPAAIISPTASDCGIPLNIPVPAQLKTIKQALPSIMRLGLLYDPAHNQTFFEKARQAGTGLDIDILPLAVASKKEIPAVMSDYSEKMDGLWLIPDRTVISESIVQYIIKQAVIRNIPVTGYNRFFYDSGAALAFVFDYEELGRQAARLAEKVLRGQECRQEPPVFHGWLNSKILQKMRLEVPEIQSPSLEMGR